LTELAVAAALLPATTAPWGALGALALLLLFVAGISFNLARGHAPDCHCFGQIHSAPAGWKTLLRNGALAVVAGFLVWQGWGDYIGPSAVGWIVSLSALQLLGLVGGALVLGLLAGLLVYRLWQNGYFAGGAAPPRDDASVLPRRACGGVQQDMPPPKKIGEPAPEMKLRAPSGGAINLWSLGDKETLVFFYNPRCVFCQQMLPDLEEWEKDRAEGAPELLVVSTDPERMDLDSPVMYDRKFALFRDFGANETPSAVLVDAEGKIGSELVVGAPEVLELANNGKRREESPVPKKGELI
jgi:thiol-disulfide isomerase/thioredoxin